MMSFMKSYFIIQKGIEHIKPINKVITAYDIANIVAFLSSPISKSINGEPIPAGGGMKGFIYY